MRRLPDDHPDRYLAANEVHARPNLALNTPERASYVAVVVALDQRERELRHVQSLCERFGAPPPAAGVSHFIGALGPFRLKWERHGEFSAYTVFAPGQISEDFGELATNLLPEDWLSQIPGKTVMAAHAKLLPASETPMNADALSAQFGGSVVIGAEIASGAGFVYTDFVIQQDGFVRFLLLDRSFTPHQAGRVMQRLFEIEVYRVLALLALPIARREAPQVQAIEQAMDVLTDAMAREDRGDETLLTELTALAARVESVSAATQYRFSASRAYYDLLLARVAELREGRLSGLQTIEEFMARRLAPAMATCESMARRLNKLSDSVARASGLLTTRVGIVRETQNKSLLQSMDRRAQLQLRLQSTVEGLSVAAITYYVVGLVGYGAKAVHAAGVAVNTDLVVGIAIPVVAVVVAFAVRLIKRRIVGKELR